MRDLNSRLPGAQNFRYREFVKSSVATRLDIDNTPPGWCWLNVEKLAKYVLQPIRNEFGPLRILSGFRSKKLNKKIGGSTLSNHCIGQAVDIEPWNNKITLIDMADFIIENLEFRNLILEYMPDGWLHLDYREDYNLNMVRLKDKNHNYKDVTMEYVRDLYKEK